MDTRAPNQSVAETEAKRYAAGICQDFEIVHDLVVREYQAERLEQVDLLLCTIGHSQEIAL